MVSFVGGSVDSGVFLWCGCMVGSDDLVCRLCVCMMLAWCWLISVLMVFVCVLL